MSAWTHISGMVRMSGSGTVGCNPTLGPTTIEYPEFDGDHTDYSKYEEAWRQAEKAGTPCGSEGSVQWSWTSNEKDSSVIAGHFSIWGDLRDFESADVIFEWLKQRIKALRSSDNMWLRECAVKVRTIHGTYLITEQDDPSTEDRLCMIQITSAMKTLYGEV